MSFPRSLQSAGLYWVLALGLGCGLLGSCVNLGRRDAFPVASQPISPGSLPALASGGGDVYPLRVFCGGRPVTTYYAQHPGARGVLIFFGGSGNEVETSLKGLGRRTAALRLDLVVFSYYQQGEAVPSVADVREKARAVYHAVRAMRSPAARSIYLLGHSLGGWFALDVAAGEKVQGLTLAGAETTPKEVIRRTDFPWADLVAIRPDDDARQLDASRYAPRVFAPTLVVTSRADRAVPAVVGQEVFGLLPRTTSRRLAVLEGVPHGGYFVSDEFWRRFADFFGLTAKARQPAH